MHNLLTPMPVLRTSQTHAHF